MDYSTSLLLLLLLLLIISVLATTRGSGPYGRAYGLCDLCGKDITQNDTNTGDGGEGEYAVVIFLAKT